MNGFRNLLCAALLAFPPAIATAAEGAAGDACVRIENVEVRVSAVGPVVLLKVRNKAIPVFVDAVVAELRARGATVATGVFGAQMAVASVNDGPFTVLVEV